MTTRMAARKIRRLVKEVQSRSAGTKKPESGIWVKPERAEVVREEILAFAGHFADEHKISSWSQFKKRLRKEDPDLYVYCNAIKEQVRTWFVKKRAKEVRAWRRQGMLERPSVVPKSQAPKAHGPETTPKEEMYRKIMRECFGFGKGRSPPNGAWVTVRMNEHTAKMRKGERERFEGCWESLKKAGIITVEKVRKDRMLVTVQIACEVQEQEMHNALQQAIREEQAVNPQFHTGT